MTGRTARVIVIGSLFSLAMLCKALVFLVLSSILNQMYVDLLLVGYLPQTFFLIGRIVLSLSW